MGRIRTVKPEFFTSPDTARASVEARLLYIAMWCWADDWGVGVTNINGLLGFAFPDEDERGRKEVQSLCKEIADAFGVRFYTVEERAYFQIPAWDKHQKTQRRAERRNPTADHAEAVPDQRFMHEPGTSELVQGTSVRSQGRREEGTGEQGNRGTGEQGNRGTGEREQGKHAPAVLASEFDRAWSHWPKKVEKQPAFEKFKTKCRTRVPSELADDIVRFGEAYAATTDKQFVPGLAVWLNRERWTDELPQSRGNERALTRTEENMNAVMEMRAREMAASGWDAIE